VGGKAGGQRGERLKSAEKNTKNEEEKERIAKAFSQLGAFATSRGKQTKKLQHPWSIAD